MESYLKQCVLYGAGLNAHGLYKYIGSDRVVGVIDSSLDRIGNDFEGIEINSLDMFLRSDMDIPIIISAYQREEDIIQILKSHSIKNYLVSLYIQSSVTELSDIVDEILEHAKGRRLLFDNTINFLVPLILDELVKRGYDTTFMRFLNCDNKIVARHYGLKKLEETRDQFYLISTAIVPIDTTIFAETHVNVCNLMYYNKKYWNFKLEKFKGRHKGQRCFVIGNGPSLNMHDLDKLNERKEICFGSNGIFYAYDRTVWRPDYYVITDFMKYKELYDRVLQLDGESVFVRRFYNMEGMDYIANANIYNSPPQRNIFEFSDDIAKAVYAGMTVTYNMLQIAAYMGFSEIYLLGVDFSFATLSGNETNHFDIRYEKNAMMKDIFYRDENLAAYQSAEKYSRNHGFRIYNATRGGKLEVFERVDFDSLMSEEGGTNHV